MIVLIIDLYTVTGVMSSLHHMLLCFQLDSATSLIQSARNLMTAVVLAVKASYVASTKYTRTGYSVSYTSECVTHSVCSYIKPLNKLNETGKGIEPSTKT